MENGVFGIMPYHKLTCSPVCYGCPIIITIGNTPTHLPRLPNKENLLYFT